MKENVKIFITKVMTEGNKLFLVIGYDSQTRIGRKGVWIPLSEHDLSLRGSSEWHEARIQCVKALRPYFIEGKEAARYDSADWIKFNEEHKILGFLSSHNRTEFYVDMHMPVEDSERMVIFQALIEIGTESA